MSFIHVLITTTIIITAIIPTAVTAMEDTVDTGTTIRTTAAIMAVIMIPMIWHWIPINQL